MIVRKQNTTYTICSRIDMRETSGSPRSSHISIESNQSIGSRCWGKIDWIVAGIDTACIRGSSILHYVRFNLKVLSTRQLYSDIIENRATPNHMVCRSPLNGTTAYHSIRRFV